MFSCIGIPALRGINHAEQFVDVEVLGKLAHQLLQPRRCIRETIGIVQLYRFLKAVLQLLVLFSPDAVEGGKR